MFCSKRTFFSLLMLSLVLNTGHDAFARDGSTSTIHPAPLLQLREEALRNNQSLIALRKKIAAREAEISMVGAWEDPRIGLGLGNVPVDSFELDQEPMTQKLITLSQRLPWFGRLDLKSKSKALDAAKMEAAYVSQSLALSRRLAEDYYQLGFIAASQKINQRLIDLLGQIARIAEARYAAGKGLQQDVLQAQVEQSRLIETRNTLLRQRRQLEYRISGVLNRNSLVPIPPPTLESLPPVALVVSDLQQKALSHNPQLVTLKLEIEKSAVEVKLARKAYFPDPDLRLSYGQRDDAPNGDDRADFVSGTIVFSLPVWAKSKQRRGVEAALRQEEAARLQYQDMVSQLPFRIDETLTELNQIRANHDLYQNAVLLQAEQWADSAMISYKVGKIDFNAMISAQLRVLMLQLAEEQYLYQYYRKLANLEETVGLPLSDI